MSARGPSGRWLGRLPLVSLLAGLLVLLLPALALAHAQVVSTDPVDGARLAASPPQVSVTFNEPVTLAPGGLRVVRPDGALADVGDEVDSGTTVSQPIGPLSDGWYVMAWSIVSEDGHVVHGSATFAVGDADAASRPTSPFATPLQLALWLMRGLSDLATLVAGGAAIAWCVLGARTRRVRRLLLGAVVTGVLATAVWLGVELSDAGTDWLSTEYAIVGVVHLALLAVALALLFVRPWRPRVAAVALVAAVGTLGWGGHATGSLLTTLALTAHLLAAVTWLGAAPAVALVLWDRGADDASAAGVVGGFSRLATVALAVLIVGGSTAAWLLTEGLAAGITGWVWILAAKVTVVGAAALGGFLGRRRLRDFDRGHYRRLFLLDATLLVVVAALSSALNLVGPHEGMAAHDMGDVMVMTGSPRCTLTLSGDGGAAFIADPGTSGTNTLRVIGPDPSVQGVSVSLSHPFAGGAAIEVPLAVGQTGWEGSAALPFTGTWTATVRVRVDTFTERSGSCDFAIAP